MPHCARGLAVVARKAPDKGRRERKGKREGKGSRGSRGSKGRRGAKGRKQLIKPILAPDS
jgi:ribosomal protein L15